MKGRSAKHWIIAILGTTVGVVAVLWLLKLIGINVLKMVGLTS